MGQYKEMAKRHWETARPNLVKRLKAAGIYEEVLEEVEEMVVEQVAQDTSMRGVPHHLAQEKAVREKILFPTEEEQPVLTPDQFPWFGGE